MSFRIEKDTMGEVQVPANAYYGAQTQRSRTLIKCPRKLSKHLPI
jgi:fumarate hydratase class II